jgi:DNA-directed RNA polymerase alpha subunit
MVNIGCLLSLEPTPTSSGPSILEKATIKRMTEFSSNYPAFKELQEKIPDFHELTNNEALKKQLQRSVDCLELTGWQVSTIKSLNINTIGELLSASESRLKEARYVGDIRSRDIKNAAYAAIFEYLLG